MGIWSAKWLSYQLTWWLSAVIGFWTATWCHSLSLYTSHLSLRLLSPFASPISPYVSYLLLHLPSLLTPPISFWTSHISLHLLSHAFHSYSITCRWDLSWEVKLLLNVQTITNNRLHILQLLSCKAGMCERQSFSVFSRACYLSIGRLWVRTLVWRLIWQNWRSKGNLYQIRAGIKTTKTDYNNWESIMIQYFR